MEIVKVVKAGGIVNQDAAPLHELSIVYGNIVAVVLGLAAIILFIMLLVGGFKYMTSGGDPKAAESARNTLTYAIAGLVLIISAYFIINFVASWTGVQGILNFVIYRSGGGGSGGGGSSRYPVM